MHECNYNQTTIAWGCKKVMTARITSRITSMTGENEIWYQVTGKYVDQNNRNINHNESSWLEQISTCDQVH